MIIGLNPPEQKALCKDNILELVSEGDIMSYYVGRFKVGHTILSPFRNETTASFLIKNKGGHFSYVDLADSSFKGDCFDFLMQFYNIDFSEALSKINQDFGLGLDGGEVKNYRSIIKALPKHKEKSPSVIETIPRPFTARELDYWTRHLQRAESLEKENITAIGQAFINGNEIRVRGEEMAFCYDFPEIGKKKLYYPERKQKDGKWWGSINPIYVEGKENIIGASKAIIQKSRKDRLCVTAFGIPCCNVQNESNIAFTEEFVQWLKDNVGEVWLWFDRDKTGIKESNLICEQYGFKQIFTPDTIEHKDIASWIYNTGDIRLITNYLMETMKL